MDDPQVSNPVFQPFYWHGEMPTDGTVFFIETVKDVAAGIEAALQLISADNDTETFEEQRLLGDNCSSKLLRLSIAAASMLSQLADRNIEHRCERVAQEKKKQKERRNANATQP